MPDAKKPKKHIHRYSGVHLCRKRWKLIHKNIILYDGLSEPLKNGGTRSRFTNTGTDRMSKRKAL